MSEPQPTSEHGTAPEVPGFVERARDSMTVRRVFGDPIEHAGTIVVPAAYVWGGAGGGGGLETDGRQGTGGGFGLRARPAGALVIRDGDARWEPAADAERRIIAGAVVAVVAILAVRSLLRPRRRFRPRFRPRFRRRG